MTPRIGEDFVRWKPPTGGDSTLGIVDFSISPHLDHELLPENSMADAERWAAGIPGPAYAIDDQTATKVTDAPSKSSPRGGAGNSSPTRTESPATGDERFRTLVHLGVRNPDIGAKTLRYASVQNVP